MICSGEGKGSSLRLTSLKAQERGGEAAGQPLLRVAGLSGSVQVVLSAEVLQKAPRSRSLPHLPYLPAGHLP